MVRILVAADLHGYLNNLARAIALHPEVGCVLVAGDTAASAAELAGICGALPCYSIQGNNDPASAYPEELVLSFFADPAHGGQLSPVPKADVLTFDTVCRRTPGTALRILLTHGHRYLLPDFESIVSGSSRIIFKTRTQKPSLSGRALQLDAEITIFGHTHTYYEEYRADMGRYFLNPGSLSLPAGCSSYAASYAILECGESGIRFTQLHLPEPQAWY